MCDYCGAVSEGDKGDAVLDDKGQIVNARYRLLTNGEGH